MIYFLVLMLLIAIIGPNIWVQYTLKKYSKELPQLPGTGGEFAVHLLQRFGLNDIKVELGETNQDHFSPLEKCIRLSPQHFNGKSVSAISIAAHEVGHAIQYHHHEPITKLRDRYTPIALVVEKIAIALIGIFPLIIAILKVPQLGIISALAGIIALFTSVILQFIVLPMEWDASFNKAYPMIEKGEYLPKTELPHVKKILRAAAMTYVAATLSSLLNIWRWLRIFKR